MDELCPVFLRLRNVVQVLRVGLEHQREHQLVLPAQYIFRKYGFDAVSFNAEFFHNLKEIC